MLTHCCVWIASDLSLGNSCLWPQPVKIYTVTFRSSFFELCKKNRVELFVSWSFSNFQHFLEWIYSSGHYLCLTLDPLRNQGLVDTVFVRKLFLGQSPSFNIMDNPGFKRDRVLLTSISASLFAFSFTTWKSCNFELKHLFKKGTKDLYTYGKKLTFNSFICNYIFRSANGLWSYCFFFRTGAFIRNNW